MEEELVKTDVLCIGGGIAGLMTAIRASELGAKAVVAEKGNTVHSGKARAGNDHFLCYIPEVHGPDMDAFINEMMETQQAGNFQGLGMERVRKHIAKSFEIVKLWESWGITMKYKGRYEFSGHAFPGGFRCLLRYEGRNQKTVLTEQAVNRGVQIINRIMVFDLFTDGKVIGAIGIDTRENRIIVFEAKSVILGTGGFTRLYPSPSPGFLNNNASPLTLTGDGRVMAYSAGADLQDLETRRLHAGPKYFARSGQATWVGVYRDPQGKPIGPFVTKPERLYGDITPEVNKAIFQNYMRTGRGPVYMDCRGISEEDYEYMMLWLSHEGNVALMNTMNEEGIDLRRNPIEFMTYDNGCGGRICVNEEGETSIKGLYSAGDEVANGVSNASVFGWIVGENAANYVKGIDFSGIGRVMEQIEEKKRLLEETRSRETGAGWKEVNIALQQIMNDYAGEVRSEALLEAGLGYLRRLRDKALTTMIAKNQHELGRCLEVLNLLDLGELVFVAAQERKETRGTHVRSDYPMTNPRLNKKALVIKKIDGKPVAEWIETRK